MQGCATIFYLITAIIIYYYTGPGTPSPALQALTTIVAKVAWGLAIPTIVVAGIVNGHVACKAIYVRMHEGTNVIHQNSFKSWASWICICATLWIISWIIAEAIPSFPQLLALVVRGIFPSGYQVAEFRNANVGFLQSALFTGWFSCKFRSPDPRPQRRANRIRTVGVSGVFWLRMNWGRLWVSKRKRFLTCVNIGVIILGVTIVSALSADMKPIVDSPTLSAHLACMPRARILPKEREASLSAARTLRCRATRSEVSARNVTVYLYSYPFLAIGFSAGVGVKSRSSSLEFWRKQRTHVRFLFNAVLCKAAC
jgi:hypothetical protein